MSGPKPKERVGETKTMRNGMEATIVRYKSSAEIDVKFEDGVIVENKKYDSFQKGLIGHPDTLHKCKLKDRTGEVNRMSNGMNAKILIYRDSKNVDVEFEDGTIRTGCAYKEFRSGNIAHPNCMSTAMAESRLGETRMMNCGLNATITKYNNYHDVEIVFEDGKYVYPVDYGRFLDGSIAHPKQDGNMSLQEAAITFYLQRLGFIKMSRGSMKDIGLGNFELDLYNQEMAIAVEIDGRFHKSEAAVKRDVDKNAKCHSAGIALYRFRTKELPLLNDGLSTDLLVDGERLYNGLVDCGSMLKEFLHIVNIQTPSNDFVDFKRDLELILQFYFEKSLNYNKKDRVGEKKYHKVTDQFMTIIDYKDYHHVDVLFDDGAIATNKNYGAFARGEIKHPHQTSDAKKESRLRESRMMNCGVSATIIAYRNADDMDIEFEDGTVRKRVTYYNFSKGNIKNN